jgi:hypothetical protein
MTTEDSRGDFASRGNASGSAPEWPTELARPKGISYRCGRWRLHRRQPGATSRIVASSPTVEGLLEQISQLPPVTDVPRDPNERIWPDALPRPRGTTWSAIAGRWLVRRDVNGDRRTVASGRTPDALLASLTQAGHSVGDVGAALRSHHPPAAPVRDASVIRADRRELIARVWARICARRELEDSDTNTAFGRGSAQQDADVLFDNDLAYNPA